MSSSIGLASASVVRRAQMSDMGAFAQLVKHFKDMAYGYAYSIPGDFHLAQDAVQESFL